jgi:hypothetical protein
MWVRHNPETDAIYHKRLKYTIFDSITNIHGEIDKKLRRRPRRFLGNIHAHQSEPLDEPTKLAKDSEAAEMGFARACADEELANN